MIPILATLPILTILVLMLWARWSAAGAGIVGAAVALVTALLIFDFPERLGPDLGIAAALGGTAAEAGFTALTILWIIGPALGIHELQLRTGAAEVLRSTLSAFAPDPRILALLVAWFFALFMEGAAGFGASVALAAPFLAAAGFRPVEAVTAALLGHAVGVSFGAIGTPVLPQVALTGLSGLELARATGIYHSLLGWFPLAAMIGMVARFAPGDTAEGRIWVWTAVAFGCFVVPYTLLWRFVGPELPTLAGALFGGILFVLLIYMTNRGVPGRAARQRPENVFRAAAPYLVLVGFVLLTRLVPALRAVLQDIELQWSRGDVFSGSIQPLYHPGTMLLLGFTVGALLQGASRAEIAGAFVSATRRLVPVAIALVAMLVLSRLMVHGGMTAVLAATAAAGAGGAWPALAPFVGALGSFVTGSATASNILFTDFQRDTAIALGLPVPGLAGAQGFGAAAGNIICPHNLVAAGATVGLQGREGEVLKRTLWVALLYATLGGGVAWWILSRS